MNNSYEIALSFGPETTKWISHAYGYPLPRVGDYMKVPREFYESIAEVTNNTWKVENVIHNFEEVNAPHIVVQLVPAYSPPHHMIASTSQQSHEDLLNNVREGIGDD